jgi:hypothetical protein
VDCKPLKADLLPSITSALDRIKALLVVMAREHTMAALQDLNERIALLEARPTELPDFMDYQVGKYSVVIT